MWRIPRIAFWKTENIFIIDYVGSTPFLKHIRVVMSIIFGENFHCKMWRRLNMEVLYLCTDPGYVKYLLCSGKFLRYGIFCRIYRFSCIISLETFIRPHNSTCLWKFHCRFLEGITYWYIVMASYFRICQYEVRTRIKARFHCDLANKSVKNRKMMYGRTAVPGSWKIQPFSCDSRIVMSSRTFFKIIRKI